MNKRAINDDDSADWLEGDDSRELVNPRELSTRQLADALNVTPSTVARWTREGAPAERSGGLRSPLRYDVAKIHAWLMAQAAQNGDPDSLASVKLRDRLALAQIRELTVAVQRSEVITRADARQIYSEHVTEFRKRLLEVPDQIAALSDTQRAELDDAINRALAEFAGLPAPPTRERGGDDWRDVAPPT